MVRVSYRLVDDSCRLILNSVADHDTPVAVLDELKLVPNVLGVVWVHQHNLAVQDRGIARSAHPLL